MEQFTRIKTFIKAVEAGSFSAAARDVSSVSSVARQVKSLEEELGVRLLNRSSRNLSLTDAGRRFFERTTGIVRDLETAVSEAKSLQEDVRGLLRVALRVSAGTTVVVPALAKLQARYPELSLDISLVDERRDLISSNIDVAMWLGDLPNADIVARRLSPNRRIVCAAEGYLERFGIPETPQELTKHNCLVFSGAPYSGGWSFTRDGTVEKVEVKGNIRSDNALVLLSAGIAGLGLIIVQEWMVRHHIADGRMRRVLEPWSVSPRPGDGDLYAVYPSSRGVSRNVRVFVDFLIEIFGAEIDNSRPDRP
jgi:DNA-binding transcriptional LysR family regulator